MNQNKQFIRTDSDFMSQGVYIEDGVIKAVSRELAVPAGAVIIAGAGKTLLPGFIAAHTHVFSEAHLRQALVFGVTTVLDMFMETGTARRIKDAIKNARLPDAADLRTASTANKA